MKNNLKKKIKSGDKVIGTWLHSNSNVIAQITAEYKFDFLCIDLEHSTSTVNDIFNLVNAIRAVNTDVAVLVRIDSLDYGSTKKLLDLNINGIICPAVENEQTVELINKTIKYPPEGSRGLGYCPSNSFGTKIQAYFKQSNIDVVCGIQIENVIGLNNIDSILHRKNIDFVFVGPFDLSASLGHPGDFDSKEYKDAVKHIKEKCKMYQIPFGQHYVNADNNTITRIKDDDAKVIAFSIDTEIYKCHLNNFFNEYK